MKTGIVSLLLLFSCQILYAQGNQGFEEFRSQMMKDFHTFRKGVLEDYTDFLNGIWKDYQLFKSGKPDSIPKPLQAPTVETIPDTSPVVLPDAPERPVKPDNPVVGKPVVDKPIFAKPLQPDVPIVSPVSKDIDIDYYGVSIKVPNRIFKTSGNGLSRNQIANYWKKLEENHWEQVSKILLEYKKKYNYNDFMYYLLVNEYVRMVEPDAEKRCVQKLFLMVYSGYDARIAYHNETLVLMLPFANQIYACTYILQNGIKYYLFPEEELAGKGMISTYEITTKQNDLRVLYTNVLDNPHLAVSAKSFNLSDGVLTISGTVNEFLMGLLFDLPQMNNELYALPILDESCRKPIVDSLRKQLEGKTKLEALQALMHFMHYAFEYATDQEQFGKEKPFFFEELLYYPECDCEDRSVFFAYLVRNVLDLECHLLDFPGHIAVAVAIDGAKGTYYMHNGKRFYITDPTYIGASVGDCMPDYRGVNPKILLLK